MTVSLDNPYLFSVLAGPVGFNEAYFSSNPDTREGREWGSYRARLSRYEVLWGHYEGNVYRQLHRWADRLKANYELYSAIRTIYSPFYRIGEFWAGAIYGGLLDIDAGDGQKKPSAIPIVTQSEAIRPILSRIWRLSNMQAQKDIWARFGSVMGDAPLLAHDDVQRQRVTFRPVHPRTVRDADLDSQGNVKAYVLEELRPDPRETENPLDLRPEVRYIEVCTRVGGRVRYRTYLDDDLFDWRAYPSGTLDSERIGPDWTVPYDFVPMVMAQHRNMGLGWGWAEAQPSLGKGMELDEQASKLHDQVRKLVDCPWLFAGIQSPGDLTIEYPDDDGPTPERSRIPAIYAKDPAARAYPLVAPLDLMACLEVCRAILADLEKDHPELQADMAASSGDASGRALRVAREKTEKLVIERRANYDDALVRVQAMAISIGAVREYPGFEAFTADSYARGELAHEIGDRPVFAIDAMDRLEEAQARAAVLATLTGAGMPLFAAMRRAGYSEAEITEAKKEQTENEARAAEQAAAAARTMVAVGGITGRPSDPKAVDAPDRADPNPATKAVA